MQFGKGNNSKQPTAISDILKHAAKQHATTRRTKPTRVISSKLEIEPSHDEDLSAEESGRYDFDLAEFPLFRLYKNTQGDSDRTPLVYSDQIKGRDGSPIRREWKVFPGAFGFGGSSAQVLLYDLIQLYLEQGGEGSQIQFGTLRSLFQRRGLRNPSSRDYDRMRRDIDILRGYDFHCKNAFWDVRRKSYVDMNWRLFGSVFYFRPSLDGDEEHPFGFLEVSPVLQQVAKRRGFFALGFSNRVFYSLKPKEQRLAVYLAKKFASQQTHRRYVEDLARALPIETSRPRDTWTILRRTAEGLLARKLPILQSFRLDEANDGRMVAVFERGARPAGKSSRLAVAIRPLSDQGNYVLERIAQEIGSTADRLWWSQCIERLGVGPMERALGQLREARGLSPVRNPGGLLTKIIKDIAAETGVALRG